MQRGRRAWIVGALPSLLLFAWVLSAEGGSLLQHHYFDDFYDAQARSFFDGDLDIPPEVVGFEGFIDDGRTYIYFGPVPALLRMPVMAVTDRFDGRLTSLSMLGAALVLAVAAYRLTAALRRVLRGTAPVGRREQWATAGLAAAVLTGPPLFLASDPVVYHEAALWGVALSIAGYDAAVRWRLAPSAARLAVAATLIALALQTRQVIAFGPLAALALFGGQAWLAGRSWQPRRVAALAAACLIPLGLSCAVTYAKFEMVFGIPMDRQTSQLSFGNRAAVLAENPGYASLDYLPTTLLTYLRPDGVDPRADFPWIDFPRGGPTVVGDPVFDVVEDSASLPATAPALVVLTVGGAVALARARQRGRRQPDDAAEDESADDDDGNADDDEDNRGRDDDESGEADDRDEGEVEDADRGDDRAGEVPAVVPLWPLYLGAGIGAGAVLVFAYVAHRYLLDFYPLVVIGGIVGFHSASRLRREVKRVAMVGLGALVVVGAVTNLALALQYQNERGAVVPEDRRARWIGWRLDLPGAPDAHTIGLAKELPPVADGDLLAVGDCDGLYVGVSDQWFAVERGPGVGVHDVRVDIDELDDGVRYPLATFGDGDESTVVAVVRVGEDEARVDVLFPAFFESGWQLGSPFAVDTDEPLTLRLDTDPRQASPHVSHDGDVVNVARLPTLPPFADATPTLGRAPTRPGVEPRLPGGATPEPADTNLCEQATQ